MTNIFSFFISMLWVKFLMGQRSSNKVTSYDLWQRAEAATSFRDRHKQGNNQQSLILHMLYSICNDKLAFFPLPPGIFIYFRLLWVANDKNMYHCPSTNGMKKSNRNQQLKNQ